MDGLPPRLWQMRQEALCEAVGGLVPGLQANAAEFDREATFPQAHVATLRDIGAFVAPFPRALGGLGLGTEPHGALALSQVLRLLGHGNLAVGRLYEAHVNAIRLICRYGSELLQAQAAKDAHDYLFGLWVTDPPNQGLTATKGGLLYGNKAICSGAGALHRAVVTATDANGNKRLAYVTAERTKVTPAMAHLQGVRAATSGSLCFDGTPIGSNWMGEPGDYLREPDFSAGAWRTSAVTCGGLEALVAHAMRELAGRGRADDPHQRARMGRAWILQETASLWLRRAAIAAETWDGRGNAKDVTATVTFARLAIETACLEALTLIERSIGLSAFIQGHPIERLRRDLATYLRQPAPDESLAEATAHIFEQMH